MKGKPAPLKKNPDILLKMYTVNISPSLPPKEQTHFSKGGKGNNETFQELTDTASELTMIPKHHYGLPVRAEAYRGQVTDKVWAQIHLTVGPVGRRPLLWLLPQSQHA